MKSKLSFEPRWLAVVIFFLCGAFMGAFVLFIWIFNGGSFYGLQKVHSGSSSYKYINPTIAVEHKQLTDFFANEALQGRLNAIVEKYKKDRGVQTASVYFRDLEPGRWVGINEEAEFSAGKLLKVPIMIAYYREAEVSPDILKKQLIYKRDPNSETQSNQVSLEAGKPYSVEEIIKDMIIDDDDNAANMLFDNIDKQALNEVFSDLGVNYKEDKQSEDLLTVKMYALFFRVLYNATYLNWQNSEAVLDILSQTPDTDGISAGLPNDIVTANKFRTRSMGSGFKEGHDCGIIYFPKHPYLLCAMGIAKDSEVITNMFRDISQAVYLDMSDKYKN